MKNYKLVIALILIGFELISAQDGSVGTVDAKSSALGKATAITTNGLYSIGNNPANLFLGSSTVEVIAPIPLPNVSVQAGTNFFTLNEYDYFFGQKFVDENGKEVGRYLTEADKGRFKDLFAEGGAVTTDLNLKWFGIAVTPNKKIGTIAFSISDVISSNATFPKDIVSLLMDGNEQNRIFNFNDTKLKAWWLRKYSLSYARSFNILPMFQEFSAGVTFNFIKGYAYAGIDEVKTQLVTDANNAINATGNFLAHSAFSKDFAVKYDFDINSVKKDSDVGPFPEPAGSGFGFDFGFNAKINEKFSVAFAMTDIGSVTWDQNAAEFSYNRAVMLDDLTNESQRDSLIDALTGKGSGKYISSFLTDLPTAMRFGLAIQVDKVFKSFPGAMMIAFDFAKGFNDQPRNSTKPRFSMGVDWQPFSVLAFRTGFAFGGIDEFGWGLGLGFDFGLLELNFGTPDFQYVISQNNAKRVTVAFDSRWKF